MKQRFTHFRSSDHRFDITDLMRGEVSVSFNLQFRDRGEEREIEVSAEQDPETKRLKFVYDYPVPMRHRSRFRGKLAWQVLKAILHLLLFETEGGLIVMSLLALVAVTFLIARGHPTPHFSIQ